MEIEIDESDKKTLLRLTGSITFKNSNDLRKVLVKFSEKKTKKTYVDMSHVDYVDSSAIATFIEFLQLIRPYRGILVLTNLNETCKEIFKIARLDKIFTFDKEI